MPDSASIASLLVVAIVLVALMWLCLRQPRRTRGCCAGAWPPDDLSRDDRGTGSDMVDVAPGAEAAAADRT